MVISGNNFKRIGTIWDLGIIEINKRLKVKIDIKIYNEVWLKIMDRLVNEIREKIVQKIYY